MECLIYLCFISQVYITGEIGRAYYPEPDKPVEYYERSNHFHKNVAEASIVMEFTNNMYIEVSHISGVDTMEPFDYGLNRISLGGKIYLFKGKE